MKAVLVLFVALMAIHESLATQTRVFFFVKSPDGGASFRLQCVQNPPANRCPVSVLKQTGEDLCKKNGLALKELRPFSCLNEEKDRACKYVNGICAPKPKTKKEEEKLEESVQESSRDKIPTTEELQKVEELPKEISNEERPLKKVEDLGEIAPLPNKLPDLE